MVIAPSLMDVNHSQAPTEIKTQSVRMKGGWQTNWTIPDPYTKLLIAEVSVYHMAIKQ